MRTLSGLLIAAGIVSVLADLVALRTFWIAGGAGLLLAAVLITRKRRSPPTETPADDQQD